MVDFLKELRKSNPYIIYAIRDEYGHIRYIGQSKNGVKRTKSHFQKSTLKNSHLPIHKWISSQLKFNKQVHFIVLEYVDSQQALNEAEINYIKEYKPSGLLLNLTDGGSSTKGWKPSKQNKLNIANAIKASSNVKRKKIKDQNDNIYPSIREAARQLNLNHDGIVKNLKGHRSHVKGYRFKYV